MTLNNKAWSEILQLLLEHDEDEGIKVTDLVDEVEGLEWSRRHTLRRVFKEMERLGWLESDGHNRWRLARLNSELRGEDV